MNPPPTITRKELSYTLKISVRTICRHEKQWGLKACRALITEKPVQYFFAPATKALRRARVIA